MGQRLNIEIMANGKSVANIYQHWNAYTSVAIEETKKLIKAYYELKDKYKEDHLLLAIQMGQTLESKSVLSTTESYAGLDKEDYKIAKGLYPDEEIREATDRNAGIISISEESMNDTRNWEEGRVEIDIQFETINFQVYFTSELKHLCFEDFIDNEEKAKFIEMLMNEPINEKFSFNIPFSKIDELENMFLNQKLVNSEEGLLIIDPIE